ncbi:MAG: FkbM family methyltransferase [Acidobacteriota bacterium]
MRQYLIKLFASLSRLLRRTPLARSRALNRLQAVLVVRLHGSDTVEVGGFQISFHPRERVLSKRLILYGGHEKHELTVLCSEARAGDVAMDIGANVGIYSLHLSRAVGDRGKVFAVEPDPGNLALLRRNLDANQCRNVEIWPYALGRRAGTVALYQVEDHRGNMSVADLQGTKRSVSVEMKTGRELLAARSVTPRLVKMDVEGSEPDVFEGLGFCPEVMLFEFVPGQIEAVGHDPLSFLERLANLGYELESVNPDTGQRLASRPVDLLEHAAGAARVCNVYATRKLTR